MEEYKILEKYIIRHRRYLHRFPELGFNCQETHDYIAKELKNLNIKFFDHVGKNSIVGLIENGEGLVLGLRADFDALPIEEETKLEFKSQNKGRMHACGHDTHTAMLLGAAKYLVENLNEWSGTVKLIFQEAEEGPSPGGALGIINSKLLEDVEEFYALHVSSAYQTGLFAFNRGEALAAADFIEIKFIGKGTHAAYPHLGIDPILMQAEFITTIQTIVSRKMNPLDKGVITIAHVTSGTTHNIIPNVAYLEGTVRTFSKEVRDMFERELFTIADNIAKSHGGTCEFKYKRGYDATINTENEALYLATAAKKVLGIENVIELKNPSMGAEDFSRYINFRKGAIGWLGIAYKDRENYPIHHAKFEVNEKALINGSKIFINLVKERKI